MEFMETFVRSTMSVWCVVCAVLCVCVLMCVACGVFCGVCVCGMCVWFVGCVFWCVCHVWCVCERVSMHSGGRSERKRL